MTRLWERFVFLFSLVLFLFSDILSTPKTFSDYEKFPVFTKVKTIVAILILAFHNESPEIYMGIIKTKKYIKNNEKPISVITGHCHHMT